MVDLNELQKEIDSLLESETDESLMNWYMSKKFPDYKKVLGSGKFQSLAIGTLCTRVNQTSAKTNTVNDLNSETEPINTKYALAA
jgi:hypothetical protein